MLNLEPTEAGLEKQTRSTQIRHGEGLAHLIERASIALAIDKSVFLRAAIAKEATRVLEEGSRHVLTAEDAALFEAALDTPPAPTPRAQRAARSYQQRVVHAD